MDASDPTTMLLGGTIAGVALTNVFSAFDTQCTTDEYARTIHKVNLLLGGSIFVAGLIVAFSAYTGAVDSPLLLPAASGFLLVQSIVSLTGTNVKEEDCESTGSLVVNIVGLLAAIGGGAMTVYKR